MALVFAEERRKPIESAQRATLLTEQLDLPFNHSWITTGKIHGQVISVKEGMNGRGKFRDNSVHYKGKAEDTEDAALRDAFSLGK